MIEKYLQNLLRLSKSHDSDLFVVGGPLRDLLLRRKCSDFDFSTHNASSIAKKYSQDIKSPLVSLDTTPGRETFRVVIRKNIYFDFSELQGDSIESDLNKRDFTINSMAISLQSFVKGTKKFIDPHNGKDDIKKKVIRIISNSAFLDDPLRMLRAFRFMSVIGFQIEGNTFLKVKKLKSNINKVAPERIFNELKLLLSSKMATPSILSMHRSGLLKTIFPMLYKNTEAPSSLRILEHLESLILNQKEIRLKSSTKIKKALSNQLELIKLASILYPLQRTSPDKTLGGYQKRSRKTKIGKILTELHASNADIDFISAIASCADSANSNNLNFAKNKYNPIKLYQFTHQNQEGLIPGLFLNLANRNNLPVDHEWKKDSVTIATQNVLGFYFGTYLPAKEKKPLLDGNDIQKIFQLKPNHFFATILYKVEGARVLGMVSTRSQAISFAKNIIDSN